MRNRASEEDGKRVEDALRFSEERFRSAMQHSPIGMALIAPDGSWLEVNPALCAILGYTRDELRGTTFQTITHPEDLEADESAVRRLLSRQMDSYQAEKRYVRKDRSPVWVQLNVSLVRNEAGDVRYFVCQIQDITERRRVEQALAASEGLLRQFIKHAPAAIAMLDTDMKYLQASDRWLTDYHLEGRKIIGKSHYEVFPDIPERWKEVHRRVMAGAVERCDEDPFPRGDGKMEWLQWEVRPWLKAEGSIGGLIMLTQVITARKEMEEAVRLSEDRLRASMQHSPIGMALVSPDGRWIEVNPALCRIIGYTREELLARDFQSITHPDDLEADLKDVRRMLAREIEAYEMEKRYVHKDGHAVWVQLNVSLLWDAEGKPRHFVSQIQDISARRAAEDARKSLEVQLHQAQKMESLGTLAGGIAHDFNNILGAILGNVELATSDAGAHPTIQESLAAIGKAAHRARDLVRQILAFSRQQTQELRPVKLAVVVDEAVRLMRATLPAALEIRTHLDRLCPCIEADPTQLHQIIMNLGINAWHAMVEGTGTIDISVKSLQVDAALSSTHADLKPGPYVCLSVADNGQGMDEATLGRIFEPFFTTKAPGEGTGLGLAVAHGIMKNHLGAIRVESQPGRGTTFFLYFPVASADVEALEATPAEVSVGEGQHILYIDDEAPLVRLVVILLEQLGYRVSGFTNADEALATFRAEPGQFSLLISDLSMPGMSGLELASEVHRLRPELPAVVVSGYVTEELRKQARACGVSEIIQKPYTFQDLGELIHRLLNKSK